MKPPKNFYSNLDRRKQGLPEVPEASSADAGKIVKVGNDGDYELGACESLPEYDDSYTRRVLQITNGSPEWSNSIISGSLLVMGTTGLVSSTNSNLKVTKTVSSIVFNVFGSTINLSVLISRMLLNNYSISIDDVGTIYRGVITGVSPDTIYALVSSDGLNFEIASITASTITYTSVGSVKYYEIESSGSSVSLPSGVTFADVYAELQAGVDVKFTDGARVYSVTSFESTNIRAHWMSDLDLTSLEVYVINLGSDGTGTVASATFSGS